MFKLIPRNDYLSQIRVALQRSPAVALLGPRQCGKTTLAHLIGAEQNVTHFDLENPRDQAKLASPLLALERLAGLVILDEIQRQPELFELLRVLVDRPEGGARFLVLGSASPSLIKSVSESLAGRIAFVDLGGFRLAEIGYANFRKRWVRGGFPRSFLADGEEASFVWREDFIRTFLERDIPQLGITVPADVLRRFWTMLAHYHGQVWNSAEFARSLGTAEATARRYLDILAGAYMIRQLAPWHENLKKRQVRSPKIYIRDSGLLHSLLSLETEEDLLGHPKAGASWEGFVIEEIISLVATRNVYFWGTHGGSELDLLIVLKGKRYGIELKYTDAPRPTKSMRIALTDLKLDRLFVVYPGNEAYELDEKITVLPIENLPALLPVF